MNTHPTVDRVFPLSAGAAPRPALRPPRLPAMSQAGPSIVLGNGAFLRRWAGRRARVGPAPSTRLG